MPRIAIVVQGDLSNAATWSGVPAGLSAGLKGAGVEVVPIEARFPGSDALARVLRVSWAQQAASPAFAIPSGLSADLGIRRAGQIDGAVMIGSGYSLATGLPTVTYDDMTVAQALDRADATYDSLSERAKERWYERQRLIYGRSQGCCVASRWAARSVCDDYGIEEARVHVVGFGHNCEPRGIERDWATPRFIFVGVDWARKRGAAVLEAFVHLRERHPEATLDLVGDHPRVDATGVTPHGTLPLGDDRAQARLSWLLARSTCLVMPSTYEPFGIAYLDAAGWGIPSIGTTVGGAPDAIGECGRLVDPGDQRGLLEAMLELTDPAVAQRLGELAQARARLFTWNAVAERILRVVRPVGLAHDSLARPLSESELPRTPA